MSTQYRRSRSFDDDDRHVRTGPDGQVAHAAHLAQSEVVERRMYEVRSGVWSLVGNGLSNQSFIEAPDGIIVIDIDIDTGDRPLLDQHRRPGCRIDAAVHRRGTVTPQQFGRGDPLDLQCGPL